MKRYLKKKESKVTIKKHHKHLPLTKEALKEVDAGISSYDLPRLIHERRRKEK